MAQPGTTLGEHRGAPRRQTQLPRRQARARVRGQRFQVKFFNISPGAGRGLTLAVSADDQKRVESEIVFCVGSFLQVNVEVEERIYDQYTVDLNFEI